MNVAIISTYDIGHGAGRASYRLHKGLKKIGVNSQMIVSRKLTEDADVHLAKKTPRSKIGKFLRLSNRLLELSINYLGPQNFYSLMSVGFKNHPVIKNADIIHFHNIHSTNLNFSLSLLSLSKIKPVVWTAHDMWPFTGHCYVSYECERWKIGCGKCPYLDTFVKVLYDSTHMQWKLKKYIYQKYKPVLVTPSLWLKNIAEQSPLFQNCRLSHIPNGLDPEFYKPLDKENTRLKLQLNLTKKYLLFVSTHFSNKHKGFEYFVKALKKLQYPNKNLIILLVGKPDEKVRKFCKSFNTIHFGFISDHKKLVEIYNASDLCVLSSIADNSPNVIFESMACGTPIVAFKTGGVSEIISHLNNGYLANVGDADDLACGIDLLLSDGRKLEILKKNAVKLISEKYTDKIQAENYRTLYESLL